jgi:hypothetical protein
MVAKKSHKKKRPVLEGAPLTNVEIAFCHAVLGQEKTDPAAAAKGLGMTPHAGTILYKRPNVQEYLRVYNAAFMERMASKEVERLYSEGITRETLARRFWALGSLPPERTKGSIQGQVEALDALSGLLGFKIAPRDMDKYFEGKSDEQIRNFLNYGTFDAPAVQ